MLDRPWSLSAEAVLSALGVDGRAGLSTAEAASRLARWGANRLAESRPQSAWRIFFRQGRSVVAFLLGAAAVAAFAFREWAEGIAIGVVIAVNATLGFVTELRAVRSVESLRRLGVARTRVRRDGGIHEVPADDLVPGDVVILEAGDLVSADCRVLSASRLETDESQLTGESLPVEKNLAPVAAETVLAERSSLLYKGTAMVRGSAAAVVVATGMATELGRIASLVQSSEAERTPLEKKLDALGKRLAWVALAVATLTAGLGILSGRDLFLMIETGIALAVAAIPEGLVIVATLALARGVWRMAERKALVNRLSAVETLGAVTVICTDKTGTLTENRLTLTRLAVAEGDLPPHAEDPAVRRALEAAVLCNNAALDGQSADTAVGDPLEVALLEAGQEAGLSRPVLLGLYPELEREAFDSTAKRMATVHRDGDEFLVAVKGAPEAVLAACSRVHGDEEDEALGQEDRARWLERNHALGAQGYRVLGLAARRSPTRPASLFADLTWLGLAVLSDPPRQEARAAVADCRRAGIEVIMVTGDQAATARAIALAVGLVDDPEAEVLTGRDLAAAPEGDEARRRRLGVRLFARVDPEQKLDLVALHQQAGAVVAMTGDGVNDAPALKKADIGIAMGQRGSQVAREAADVVLKEDSFATIVAAIRQGRVIFDNIRRFVLYLVSCNASEFLVVGSAAMVAAPLPVLPLQLLFLNVVTDVFPALALGLGEGDAAIMERRPRPPAEPILCRRHWVAVAAYGAAITVAVLGALAVALHVFAMSEPRAVTVAFLTLAFAQLWHVFNMAQSTSGLLRNEVTRNPWVWGALGLCTVLLLAAVYVPPLATALKLVHPGREGWGLVAVASLVPLGLGRLASAGLKSLATGLAAAPALPPR